MARAVRRRGGRLDIYLWLLRAALRSGSLPVVLVVLGVPVGLVLLATVLAAVAVSTCVGGIVGLIALGSADVRYSEPVELVVTGHHWRRRIEQEKAVISDGRTTWKIVKDVSLEGDDRIPRWPDVVDDGCDSRGCRRKGRGREYYVLLLVTPDGTAVRCDLGEAVWSGFPVGGRVPGRIGGVFGQVGCAL